MEFDFDNRVKVFSSEIFDGSMSLFDGSFDKNAPQFLDHIGADSPVVFCEQCHSTKIKLINHPGSAGQCDGVLTTSDFVLAIRTADCVPVMIIDDDQIGAIHCGRKSLTNGIIDSLKKFLKSPTSAKFFLAPHIREKNYEIKQDVIDELKGSKWEKFIRTIGQKSYFNLTNALLFALDEIGVKRENVIDSEIDTFEDQRFFCSRRDPENNIKTFITVIYKDGSK